MSDASLSIILEAIMFTSGRSMSTDELSKIVDKTSVDVNTALSELQARIKRRQDSALQLTEVSGRWIFEVRPSLSPHLPESFRPDTPQRLLPAAALIAYHQPMAQSQLVEMLGQRAYDHVRELANLGLIDRRRDGLTRRLTTTRRFAEYFGCPEVDYRAVRSWFRSEATKAGLTSAQLAASLAPDEQMSISEFIEEENNSNSTVSEN
ncbi:SMC-Scp complex subunit ScpB [Euryarchaeota archaeon]|jgi:segregation and condensation protein B|nr:SMC-Scp complex subunit ScpB [Euryarchaeota archaeon]MDB4602741.1 SMC-Scp complex subunit ScpB [Euryarchaeota archaeon]MDC3310261.1 SMC-Scp complex subunit ScpB [Candidatus Poseidoniales archaeon]|tara:strand:+ start:875 stop:1495 length:621 start_codon:yes stop_codon:yes gene_type:complete